MSYLEPDELTTLAAEAAERRRLVEERHAMLAAGVAEDVEVQTAPVVAAAVPARPRPQAA